MMWPRKFGSRSGISLAAVLAALAAIGALGLALSNLTTSMGTNFKRSQLLYSKTVLNSDISTVLVDAEACVKTFTGVAISNGSTVPGIRNRNDTVLYQPGSTYENGTLRIDGMEIQSVASVPGGGTDFRLMIRYSFPNSGVTGMASTGEVRVSTNTVAGIFTCNSDEILRYDTFYVNKNRSDEMQGDFTINGALRVEQRFVGGLPVGGYVRAQEFLSFSDRRLKTDIRPLVSALDDVGRLRGVTFKWKADGRPDLGFVAQEVERVRPELVRADASGWKALDYSGVVALSVSALKELGEENARLKRELARLRDRVEAYERRVDSERGR